MSKFSRFRLYSEVSQLCAEQGVPFDDTDYLLGGANTVTVGVVGSGHVIYDTSTGHFAGETPEGFTFNSVSQEYFNHDWYVTLLGFFYVE